ncbi:DUF305 domain-containing protein [Actinoplanes sp. CA-054009]
MTDDSAPSGLRRSLGLLLLAVLAAFVGAGLDRLVAHASRPGDTSAEAGFARDMSSHHAQAVEMSMIAWQRGNHKQVKQFGYDFATTQQAQIGIMIGWLDQWRLSPTGSRPAMAWMPDGGRSLTADGRMPGMASKEELARLRTATGNDFDVLFLQLMIRHHLGGLHMVDAVLDAGPGDEVGDLAGSMKNGQQYDVHDMGALLTKLGGKPLQ